MATSIKTDAARGIAATIAPPPSTDIYRRAFDILAGAVLAVITLPIVLVAALGSAITLRAWPFFCHERVGKDGAPFRCVKVRTLPTTVPSYINKHELADHATPAFCRFLRRQHLDELPQLYLVIIGRMSLVGPRPEMAHLHDGMHADFASLRTSVRPGCTGLWQVSKACTELIDVTPGYDRFYVENRSVRLDLWILLQTAIFMVGLGGTISLSNVPAWARRRTPTNVIDLRPVIDLRDNSTADASLQHSLTASR